MKIAIATDGTNVAHHFGRCQKYTIVDIVDGEISSRDEVDSPPHQRGYLPKFLSEFDVEMIVAGGMGRRAQEMFSERGIETCIGVTGDIDEVIDSIVSGTLEVGESTCKPGYGEHKHKDDDCEHH